MKSSLRWCFLFSRCLIYKVHVPQAEQSLLYQAQFRLSSTFFKSFSDFFFLIFSDLQAPDSFTSSPSNSLVRIPDPQGNVNTSFDALGTFFHAPINRLHNSVLTSLPLIQIIPAISCAYLFFASFRHFAMFCKSFVKSR